MEQVKLFYGGFGMKIIHHCFLRDKMFELQQEQPHCIMNKELDERMQQMLNDMDHSCCFISMLHYLSFYCSEPNHLAKEIRNILETFDFIDCPNCHKSE